MKGHQGDEEQSEGVTFFTNYFCKSARHLEHKPPGVATFWFAPLMKKIKLTGTVEKIPRLKSDLFWNSRSREAKITLWANLNCWDIEPAEKIAEKIKEIEEKYADRETEDIPRP